MIKDQIKVEGSTNSSYSTLHHDTELITSKGTKSNFFSPRKKRILRCPKKAVYLEKKLKFAKKKTYIQIGLLIVLKTNVNQSLDDRFFICFSIVFKNDRFRKKTIVF